MAFLKRDGGLIHYEAQGKGEPLVMLRGLGRSSRYWLGFEKRLSKFFKVIQIDLRGLGRTQLPMKWTDSIDDLADDCAAILDHLKIKRCHFFGLSLGGMVVLRVASRHPDRCRSLVVANSSSADYPGFRIHPSAIKDIVWGKMRGRLSEAVLAHTIPPSVVKARGLEILKDWSKIEQDEPMPKEIILKQLLAAARFTIRGKLQGEKPPILFVYGSMDGLVPTYNTKRLHRLVKGSELKIIKGASHEIQVGHEAQMVQAIREFCLSD